MAGNSFGKLLTLTSFGESHGSGVGGVLDGFPPGISIDLEFLRFQMEKRKSSGKPGNTPRKECDQVEFLSGVSKGKSTGAPIAFWMPHTAISHTPFQKGVFKPSHAAYTYWRKYGYYDYDGGGRASARETAVRVVAGCLAQMMLKREDIEIYAYTKQIGEIVWEPPVQQQIQWEQIAHHSLFCPDETCNRQMELYLKHLQANKDSCGAVIGGIVTHMPFGLGEPVYNKLQANLSQALMGINAAKGFEIGEGFHSAFMRGSEYNDIISQNYKMETNHDGGVQGGISNGEDICFSVAFKPIPGIMQSQKSCNEKGEEVCLQAEGQNDVCAAPRVVPVVEAMTALVIADHLLMYKAYQNYSYTK